MLSNGGLDLSGIDLMKEWILEQELRSRYDGDIEYARTFGALGFKLGIGKYLGFGGGVGKE